MMKEYRDEKIESLFIQLDQFVKKVQDVYSFDVYKEIIDLKRILKHEQDKEEIDKSIEKFEKSVKQFFLSVQTLKSDIVKNFRLKNPPDITTDTKVNVSLKEFEEE